MPLIRPIHAITYTRDTGSDISSYIAPPYDVLNQEAKDKLLDTQPRNVVAIDLPHLPAKTAGPDEVYEQANRTFQKWLEEKTLARRNDPAFYVYQQTYHSPDGGDREYKRRGLFANVRVQPFGESPPDGHGAIHPHEQTFSGPKEDRMKLMRATRAQLSPIFGLYSDPHERVGPLLKQVTENSPATFSAQTSNDGVYHEVWEIDGPGLMAQFVEALDRLDVFIADGHHRYTTALNYRQRLIDEGQLDPQSKDHPADFCTFVLIAMQDPGMIVLPTHRVLGGMPGVTFDKLAQAGGDRLRITPFEGDDLSALEAALPQSGPHAMGLYNPADPNHPLAIVTTTQGDPLMELYPNRSEAWRQLDVTVLQHLMVEKVCQLKLCAPSRQVTWKFPHSLDELRSETQQEGFQLGVVMQPTPIDSVRRVSEAGELMPQKSTFFYPKIATGLVIHPLE